MISNEVPGDFKKKFDVVSCFLEHEGKVLMLHRQDYKPQGNTWGMPAGKVHENESINEALSREVEEELDLKIKPEQWTYSKMFYVKYPEYHYVYHVLVLKLDKIPELNLNLEENKALQWIKPEDALRLNLIEDEDTVLKVCYSL